MSENLLFSLTPEHEMIRNAARDFAQKEIAPIAAEFDESALLTDVSGGLHCRFLRPMLC